MIISLPLSYPAMRLFALVASFALALPTTLVSAQQRTSPGAPPGIVRVVIETEKGNISVDLDSAHAPVSVANFLRYVDGGFYDGGRFHRTVTPSNQPNDSVRIEVVQAGAATAKSGTGFPPIQLERTNTTGLRHRDGTLSMARGGPNTATSDFFICIGDQPALDFGGHRNLDGQGFAAFGQVTDGMAVVRAIQGSPANAQRLDPPIAITRIRRVAK
jgi:peptidyl-prolyl cis-trans isomerase A (cyclophilin A)